MKVISNQELEYVRNNYPITSTKKIAKYLNRKEYQINNLIMKFRKKGLKKSKEYISKINSKAGKIGGKKGGLAIIEKRRKENTLKEWQSKGGKASIKKFKEQGRFNEWNKKGIKARRWMYHTKEFKEWTSLGGKTTHKLHPNQTKRILKNMRGKKHLYKNVLFDSMLEKEVCKILVKHKLLKIPLEGKNCHIKIGRIKIDFLLDNNMFLEYHPSLCVNLKSTKEYYLHRKKYINDSYYKNYSLKIITQTHINLIEKEIKGLFL